MVLCGCSMPFASPRVIPIAIRKVPPPITSAAFGSDLDLMPVDDQDTGPRSERLRQRPLADLPLSCYALVLTPSELKGDLRWLL